MKVLVTGGAGFVGSHFVRALLSGPDAPDAVTVLDALTYAGNPANLREHAGDPRFRLVRGDVRDAALAAALLPGHDAVVHFAAESHVDRSIAGGADCTATNVLGTQTLLEAAVRAGTRTFVQVSTDEVYGSIPSGSWTEDAPLDPSSPYSASKAGADLLALAYHRTHGLDVRITRAPNTYGPRQHPEKLVPRFVRRLLAGRTVPLYGDGRNVRDWLHVEDHCRAVRLVLDGGRPGRVYHVGGGTELSNLELTGMLLEACGAGPDRVEHVADRKGHDARYSLDWTRIRTELGYRPRRPFAEGLAGTVAWYRAHPDWWDAAAPAGG
ncbi:dTDP-glucose 4,6-dehydratase [Streptomyces sp. NPDC001380]|uniref:dTDP-glucose 4,6-dehydratase n=1 Tax=Streptomyces sp. NPDC001380 TaxID=3364566 RepID=UPI003688EAC7